MVAVFVFQRERGLLLHRATLGTLVLRFRSTRSDRGTALSAQCAAGYRARPRGMEESPLSTELYRPPFVFQRRSILDRTESLEQQLFLSFRGERNDSILEENRGLESLEQQLFLCFRGGRNASILAENRGLVVAPLFQKRREPSNGATASILEQDGISGLFYRNGVSGVVAVPFFQRRTECFYFRGQRDIERQRERENKNAFLCAGKKASRKEQLLLRSIMMTVVQWNARGGEV